MRRLWIVALFLLVWGCGGKKNVEVITPGNVKEPDRVLYDQAIKDLGKSRYNVARLTLQTLINTYPDSDFLPQAKYALAESFYKEGSSSNLNQAETEFKDFITFFPLNDRADDAQLMVALTHLRQMQKADRDSSQAILAEDELTRMIESYPDSQLLDEAKQKLRAVQEVLAEGEMKVGNTYFVRKSYKAAMGRYRTVLEKYPDYSRTPDVLFSMAEALRNVGSPESAVFYSRLVSDHPFSERTAEAKMRLTELKAPIPEPNPAALARGQQPKVAERGFFGKLLSPIAHHPPVSTETGASSITDKKKEEDNPDNKDDNNNTDGKGNNNTDGKGGGSFTIDGKKKPN